jgi:hypothetical protein
MMLSGVGAALLALAACQGDVASPERSTPSPSFSKSITGNGAPSGPHYNLNIIGVPQDKTADMTGANGHVIFVQLVGGDTASSLNGKDFSTISKINKIFLFPAPLGESFQVLDANATDRNGASFQLPEDVSTTWTVWARALGKPGGSANATTNEVLCSLATLTITRVKNAKFANVSSELLFITIVVDPVASPDLATCLGVTTVGQVTVPLFNGCLQNYFWNYQNNGLKLLQLRFYPV